MAASSLVKRSVAVGVISLLSLSIVDATSNAASINGGFETGHFTSWSTIGESFIETSEFGSGPNEGIYNALLITGAAEDGELGSVSDSVIESFLNLTSGSLDSVIEANAIEGSAIQQSFTAKAGDSLSFDWNFLTNEATPETEGFNDFAVISVNGTAFKLADTFSSFFSSSSNEFDQETGFKTFFYTITDDGTYTLGLAALDTQDTIMSSGLLVDNVKLQSNIIPEPAPEPGSVLGLLTFSAFIAGLARKGKKQGLCCKK